jgi:hypothetical protein
MNNLIKNQPEAKCFVTKRSFNQQEATSKKQRNQIQSQQTHIGFCARQERKLFFPGNNEPGFKVNFKEQSYQKTTRRLFLCNKTTIKSTGSNFETNKEARVNHSKPI